MAQRSVYRHVYRHNELARLFNPKSVAVVGATPNPKAVASRTIANLSKFEGKVYRVNPRYDKIGDEPCYPSLADLPEAADCAVFCVPREGIEAALLDGAKHKAGSIGGAVVFASGYTETGLAERIAEQARLTAIARDNNIKLVGPNCLGFLNFSTRGIVAFASGEMQANKPRGPGVGIASQSGAVGFALGQAERRGVNVSHVLTFGNGADVHIADEIAYLAGDPNCAAIACLFEGMPQPAQLLEAGELAWQAGKPVVICKIGVGKDAATAALSHTGSLAGSTEAYMALFERAGFVVVPAIEQLMETAAFFAKAGAPKARGVAVMGASGGGLIAATDAAEKYAVLMPQPSDATKERIRPFMPDFGALRNPCDLTAMVTRENALAGNAVEAMLSDAVYGALVFPHTSLSQGNIRRAQGMAAAGAKLGKPVCITYSGGWLGGPSVTENELSPHLQTFQSIDRCMATLAAWHKRDDRRMAKQNPVTHTRVSASDAGARAAAMIKASPNTTLTEREAKQVLTLYGVPVVAERLVHSAAEAIDVAQALGLPVALKVESPDIPHKTEAGVLRLNVKTAGEVKRAYDAVMANAAKVMPKPAINGVLVQPMTPAGLEVMAGARIDPLFGPLIVTGLGGIFVELLNDTALDLAPITHTEAMALLHKLKGRALLNGFRGSEPVNQQALADVIVRLSEFADDQQEWIAELDVNPLICTDGRVIAVDALIVKSATK